LFRGRRRKNSIIARLAKRCQRFWPVDFGTKICSDETSMKQVLAFFVFELVIGLAAYSQSGPGGVLQLQTSSKPWPSGSSGTVNIKLVIKEGFKIPKRPSPKLQVLSTPDFEVKGETSLIEEGQGKDPEYFNAFKPISVQVRTAQKKEPGRYSLDGKFIYFYCSDREKYCSRSVETVQIPIEIEAGK
jgi:hypothetical protein